MPRPLRPNVLSDFDNPLVQVRCEPDRDEIDIPAILQEVLVRFEFILGTSFYLQFLTMDGTRVLATQRYIVVSVTEQIIVSGSNYGQTMSRTVYNRECAPLGQLHIFDKSAEVLRNTDEDISEPKAVDVDNMSPSDLQTIKKEKTGRGFKTGTPYVEMVETVRELIA